MTVWESNFIVDSNKDLFYTFDSFPIPNKNLGPMTIYTLTCFSNSQITLSLRKQTYGKSTCKETCISFDLRGLMGGDQIIVFWREKFSDTEIEKAG